MSQTEQDKYAGPGSTFVFTDSYPITPANDADLPRPVRAIRAAGAGTVKCVTGAGVDRELEFLAGETRFVYVTKVYATGTDATGLEGQT